jgi:hypothetical protein
MRETNSATSAVASEPKKDLRRASAGSADTAGAVHTSRGAGAGMGEALEISRMVVCPVPRRARARRNSALAGPGGREETRGARR